MCACLPPKYHRTRPSSNPEKEPRYTVVQSIKVMDGMVCNYEEACKPVCSGTARQTRHHGRQRGQAKHGWDQRIYALEEKPQQPPAHHHLSAYCAYSSRYDSLRISPSRMRACESWFSSCRISTCDTHLLARHSHRLCCRGREEDDVPAAPSAEP